MQFSRLVPNTVMPSTVVTAILGIISVALVFTRGHSVATLSDAVFHAVYYSANAVIAWYAYQLARTHAFSGLAVLPWFPALRQSVVSASLIWAHPDFSITGGILYYRDVPDFGAPLDFIFIVLLATAVRLAHLRTPRRPDDNHEDEHRQSGVVTRPADDPAVVVPPDEAAHSRVTRDVRARSRQTYDSARFSMVIMIVLVLGGGGASVGLWFVGQLDRIRTLEVERNRLLQLSANVEALAQTAPSEQAVALKKLHQFIQDNYNQPNAYQATLREIADKAQTSWPDIAIRATVAVLTLFLVQIFFSVYRYNQHLSNVLAAKAEALELLAVSPEDRQNLRKEMLSIAKEAPPGFGTPPATPLQELLDVLEKLKKAKGE